MRCEPSGAGRRAATIVLAFAILTAGCAAERAFQSGQTSARTGDWDAAVEYYRMAVRDAPDRPEYRIALERAMRDASRAHLAAARELEAADDLSGALAEYRQAYALDASNGEAGVKIANLQQALRERIEAARQPPPIEAMREQARRDAEPPLLDPASDELLVLEFTDTSLRDILAVLGEASGINVTLDEQFMDRTASLNLVDVTFEEALDHLLASHGAFYKVVNPTTIIVAPDTPEKRAAYEEQAIRTFYVSHGDVEELAALLNAVLRAPEMPVPPQFVPNTAANSLTVRATTAVLGIVEQVIAANDTPRAEIVVDVEILEVNRERAKQYGLDLSRYSLGAVFSPESRPGGPSAADGADGETAAGSFNLNTISGGVSIADFYTAVPAAVVHFLAQDTDTRLIAQPQLRGQEGVELSLNLGQEIPVPSTAFTPLAAGGAAFNPLTSYIYRPIGVIINMTPRVTYENEIILDLEVENSTLGPPHPRRRPVAAHLWHAERRDPPAVARRRVEPARRPAPRTGPPNPHGLPRPDAPADPAATVLGHRPLGADHRHRDAVDATHRARTRADAATRQPHPYRRGGQHRPHRTTADDHGRGGRHRRRHAGRAGTGRR